MEGRSARTSRAGFGFSRGVVAIAAAFLAAPGSRREGAGSGPVRPERCLCLWGDPVDCQAGTRGGPRRKELL